LIEFAPPRELNRYAARVVRISFMITVREATEDDAQVLAELNTVFNGVSRSTAEIQRAMKATAPHEDTLLAEESGTVVGFICCQALHSLCYEEPWVEITELYVVPARRRHGVGKALVEAAMRRAQEVGAFELVVRTNVRNSAAQHLCTEMGLEAAPQLVFRTFFSGAA
jgi:GNAT superfamily N-acetyltransferase